MRSLGRAAMAIGVMEIGDRQHMHIALAVDGAGLDQHLAGLGAMGAAVHAQRAADAARNAAIEGETGNAGVGGGARHLHVGHGGAGAKPRALLDLDVAEAAAQANDHALDAAVAHQQIRAEADHGDGNAGGQLLQEISEVGLVGGRIEHFRRTAHPEPGVVLERALPP